MTPAPPAASVSDMSEVLRAFSAALQGTSIMSRLHDPDHALAGETARQLVLDIERLGFIVTSSPTLKPMAAS